MKTVSNNALNNVSVEAFDMAKLTKLVSAVRDAHRAADGAEDARAKQEAERDEIRAQLQTALDNDDTEQLAKLNAKMRIVKAKLDESPALKVQAFDEALNELVGFFTAQMPVEKAPSITLANSAA